MFLFCHCGPHFSGRKWLVVLEAQTNASIKGQVYLLDSQLGCCLLVYMS